MCAGTSAEGSGSWTLRSKIREDAGLWRPGEVERMRRLGEGAPTGSMRGLPRGDALRSGGDMGGEGSSVDVGAVAPVRSVVCLSP